MSRKLGLISAAIVLAVAAYVAAAVVLAWPFSVQEIIRERSPLAWMSSMLLTGAAVLALVAGLQRPRAHPAYWGLSAGLFALALDERFRGHENLKALILARLFDYDRGAMGVWGDAPLVLVPIAGGALLWALRHELKGRAPRLLLGSALAAGAVALALDLATRHPVGQLFEELLEVTAETLFLVAMLTVLEPAPPGTRRGM